MSSIWWNILTLMVKNVVQSSHFCIYMNTRAQFMHWCHYSCILFTCSETKGLYAPVASAAERTSQPSPTCQANVREAESRCSWSPDHLPVVPALPSEVLVSLLEIAPQPVTVQFQLAPSTLQQAVCPKSSLLYVGKHDEDEIFIAGVHSSACSRCPVKTIS